MNVVNKIVRGDNVRPSRLHTEAGEWCGLAALPGLVPALATWVRARLLGIHSQKPWWVWSAIGYVSARLMPTDQVLEVGSGYSTLWLAKRCGMVCAIEEDVGWKERIEREAAGSGICNLTLQLEDSRSAFRRALQQRRWDVIIIDGAWRMDMFHYLLYQNSLPRLVIFDDTDKSENRDAKEGHRADYKMQIFRGFKPQTVHACETAVFERIRS